MAIFDAYLVAEYEKRVPQPKTIEYGAFVPDEANQNKENRKYLSLVGIRNLLMGGPQLVDDFAKQRFSGLVDLYNSQTGPMSFRHWTGSVIDLDTELDPKTVTSDQEALAQAADLIIGFGRRCGLKPLHGKRALTVEDVAAQLPDRKLDLRNAIPDNINNIWRYKWGICQSHHNPMTNAEVTYYVNVPDCDVVLTATLRFPYMLAELAWRAKESNAGEFPADFLDDFFARGLSDGHFNDKIRQFTTFYTEWMAKFDG